MPERRLVVVALALGTACCTVVSTSEPPAAREEGGPPRRDALRIATAGLSMPLSEGWELSSADTTDRVSATRRDGPARIDLTHAPWSADEGLGAVRAVVTMAVSAGQRRIDSEGPVQYGSLAGHEAYATSQPPGGTGAIRVHMVGLHNDQRIYLLALKAPEGSFELADRQFREALEGIVVGGGDAGAPPQDIGRKTP
jgi:hypothetical protein